jgi:hypothetical protein
MVLFFTPAKRAADSFAEQYHLIVCRPLHGLGFNFVLYPAKVLGYFQSSALRTKSQNDL